MLLNMLFGLHFSYIITYFISIFCSFRPICFSIFTYVCISDTYSFSFGFSRIWTLTFGFGARRRPQFRFRPKLKKIRFRSTSKRLDSVTCLGQRSERLGLSLKGLVHIPGTYVTSYQEQKHIRVGY